VEEYDELLLNHHLKKIQLHRQEQGSLIYQHELMCGFFLTKPYRHYLVRLEAI